MKWLMMSLTMSTKMKITILQSSCSLLDESRWSFLHRRHRLKRGVLGHPLHNLTNLRSPLSNRVCFHLAARLSCAVRFFARGNGNSLTISLSLVKLLGRNRIRGCPALGTEREVLGLQLLHFGPHIADLFEDLLLEGSVSGRSGRHSLLRARFSNRHVLLGEFEHPRPHRARGLDGA